MPPLAVMLPRQVAAYIRRHQLIRPQERLLVAVSGGPDSTALLHLLHRQAQRWPFSLGVAHFDHGLRGEASRADAVWVQELAQSLGLPCHLGEGDVRGHQQDRKISCQVAARELRHRFLRKVQAEFGYHQIALGHTADDQLELFLLRLLRGTGPRGLRGMLPKERDLIRPLLGITKASLLAWLDAVGLEFRQDISNLDRRYRRNQVRLELIPKLLEFNPRLLGAVTQVQTLLQEQEDYLTQAAQQALAAVLRPSPPGCLSLSRSGLVALAPALQKRVLALACEQVHLPLDRLTFRHLAALQHLAQRSPTGGETSLPGGWRVQRQGEELLWVKDLPAPGEVPSPAPSLSLIPPQAGSCRYLRWSFTWQVLARPEGTTSIPTAAEVAWFDYDRLGLPLQLRQVRAGDRLRPLGLQGTKKIQDILVDAKIPRQQRPFIPLLWSGEEIIWVVGLRQGETAKVTPRTRRILQIIARPEGS